MSKQTADNNDRYISTDKMIIVIITDRSLNDARSKRVVLYKIATLRWTLLRNDARTSHFVLKLEKRYGNSSID